MTIHRSASSLLFLVIIRFFPFPFTPPSVRKQKKSTATSPILYYYKKQKTVVFYSSLLCFFSHSTEYIYIYLTYRDRLCWTLSWCCLRPPLFDGGAGSARGVFRTSILCRVKRWEGEGRRPAGDQF